MSFSPGSRLGPYEIVSPLGAGGMGEVYRARHVKLGREAAVKVLPDELASDPERLHRFEREARAASALNHPTIVTIYDIGEHQGITYIAMELVQGTTLRERLARGPLGVEETVRLAAPIAEGLARAHDAGIVHRDLKPDNVMITGDGRVKILDFGLAKQLTAGVEALNDLTTMTRTTQQGVVLGTVPYMSPEQAAGRTVDSLSDQFSFGVVLYEMLCGRRPFEGDSVATLLSAILRDDPRPPRALRPDTPRELEAVVRRCLQKDPAKRFSSTGELGEALRRCHDNLLPAKRGVKVGRRAVGALVGLAAIAGGVASWLSFRDDVVRYLERERLAEIDQLTEEGRLFEAWRLTHAVLDRIPADPEVLEKLNRITIPVVVATEPAGAEVRVARYGSSDDFWVDLGRTPLNGARIPYALMRWRIEKEGFEPFEGAPFGTRPFTAFAQGFPLFAEGSVPEGMVYVPGGPYVRDGFPPVELTPYWIDRYEVTNREFKAFVDAGGYADEEHWKEALDADGTALPREELMSRLVDTTGRPGPSGWELGSHAEGEAELPVGGVSWYEAAAYCRYAGKRLPTLFHWSAAVAQDQLADIIQFSNFGRDGPAPAGSLRGLGDYGTFDMAGNVKEWVWNEAESGRYILGGGWGEPTYTFRLDADSRPPLSREANQGIRCARYDSPSTGDVAARLVPSYFATEAEPVTDEVYSAYRRMFSYDRTDLESSIDAVDDDSPHWRRETVSFEAAYGDERMIAHVFLPRNVDPPYQVVVWFPGNDVFFLTASGALASPYLFDFVPRSGRALVYPVYKGTYERHVPFSFAPNDWRDMIVMWSKDLSRTVDYIEEREDLDGDRVAYYGFSSGGAYGPVFTAVDDRFRASVLLAGGLFGDLLPEVNAVNFASRATVPTLMVNGENDFISPFEFSQKPLFDLLGAPPENKKHARLEGGHIPSDRLELIEEVLEWLDRYLGPVESAASSRTAR